MGIDYKRIQDEYERVRKINDAPEGSQWDLLTEDQRQHLVQSYYELNAAKNFGIETVLTRH